MRSSTRAGPARRSPRRRPRSRCADGPPLRARPDRRTPDEHHEPPAGRATVRTSSRPRPTDGWCPRRALEGNFNSRAYPDQTVWSHAWVMTPVARLPTTRTRTQCAQALREADPSMGASDRGWLAPSRPTTRTSVSSSRAPRWRGRGSILRASTRASTRSRRCAARAPSSQLASTARTITRA